MAEAYNLPAGVVLDLLDHRLVLLQEQLGFLQKGEAIVLDKGVARKTSSAPVNSRGSGPRHNHPEGPTWKT